MIPVPTRINAERFDMKLIAEIMNDIKEHREKLRKPGEGSLPNPVDALQ